MNWPLKDKESKRPFEIDLNAKDVIVLPDGKDIGRDTGHIVVTGRTKPPLDADCVIANGRGRVEKLRKAGKRIVFNRDYKVVEIKAGHLLMPGNSIVGVCR